MAIEKDIAIKCAEERFSGVKGVAQLMDYIKDDHHEKEKITIGKLLDEKIVIEGLFTTVLKATCVNGEYVFLTRTAGNDCVKAPIGMFEDAQIPNDLKAVDQTIREYYGMEIPYR